MLSKAFLLSIMSLIQKFNTKYDKLSIQFYSKLCHSYFIIIFLFKKNIFMADELEKIKSNFINVK